MRKATIVRLGVAAALATMGVAGAVGSGCTSSSNAPGVDGGGDGATAGNPDGSGPTGDGSTGPGPEAGPPKDAGKDVAAPPVPANLVLAHVAPGVPPIRVCFATGTGTSLGVTPISPLPEGPGAAPGVPATTSFPAVPAGTPGIYPGTIGAFPQITDLQPITITPFAILATSIANDINFDGGAGVNLADGGVEEDCVHLIGTHGLGTSEVAPAKAGRLTLGTDFFPLPAVPAGTLLDNKTYLLTINGCLPGGSASDQAAAAGYTCGPGDGGVSIGIAELDTATAVADGGIGIQFAHRSVSLENTPFQPPGAPVVLHDPASAGVWPTLIQPGIVGVVENDAGPDGGDAGVSPVYGPLPVVLGDAAAGPVRYSGHGITPQQTVPFTTVDPTTSAFGVFIQPLDGGMANYSNWPGSYDPNTGAPIPGDLLALPLSTIQVLSSWSASTAKSPTGFQSGYTYTFVLVGDPVAPPIALPNPDGGGPVPNPKYDGRSMHIVAFPNVFTSH